MATQKLKPTTIEEYVNTIPAEIQERIWSLHACILKAAPGAVESLKWNMPAYSYDKILVTFKVFKNHTGFYPMPSAITAFNKELSKFKTASGSVQLPHDMPLPLPLIAKIVRFRVKESKDGTIRWRS